MRITINEMFFESLIIVKMLIAGTTITVVAALIIVLVQFLGTGEVFFASPAIIWMIRRLLQM